ncbi:MAG: nucelotide kinase [Chaetfec virus UA24_144]|nr:MAG: nucelotide kinase [Chaetfec virus UA24_144]
MSDQINHPSHYETGAPFECIDVMEETQGSEAVKDFCVCNALKYIYRHRRKNGVEDIKKAKWYIDKYLDMENKHKEE